MHFTIGTRGSKLALWQAHWVRDQLTAAGHDIEIQIIKTTGDKLQSFAPNEALPESMAQTVAEVGSKGIFIKEIEEALLDRRIDIAVHSLKDLPTEQPAALTLGAIPPREDARDVFISAQGKSLQELPTGARIATSSLRRQTQLRAVRPDLNYVAIRGNLDTRLRKLASGECDALILAAAGVHRLGLSAQITSYFSIDEMCPAVGQGALAIEIRAEDIDIRKAVSALDDAATHYAVRAERELLRKLGGGCQLPIAAYATPDGEQLHLQGLVSSLDGSRLLRCSMSGPAASPEELGAAMAENLFDQGARQILNAV